MISRIALLASVATLALAAQPILAQNVEFSLVNESSHTLTYFYTSPSISSDWGNDLFEEIGILEPGYMATVFIGDGSDECLYDFRFETAEGGELEDYEIDICELDSYTVTD